MTVKTYLVEGINCKNCRIHVEQSIRNISGIDDVIVDVSTGQVRVSGVDVDNLKVKQSVESVGYLFKGEAHDSAIGSELWLS